MTDFNTALAGRFEDKWIEFVADESSARRKECRRTCAGHCARQVEVHASYLWLFAAALVAWLAS